VEAQAVSTSIVPGLVFVSERESGPWIDCGPCSAAMVAHYTDPSIPASLATAHKIRAAIPRPHSGGTNAPDVLRGLDKAFPSIAGRTTSRRRDDVPELLRAGYAVSVSLTASELPSRLRRWQPSFGGGHSCAMAGYRSSDGRFGWFDPLGTAGWSGEWVRWEDVRAAIWTSAGYVIAAPRAAAPPRPTPPPPSSGVTLRYGGTATGRGQYVVRLDDCRLRDRPSTSAHVIRQYDSGTTFAVAQTTRTGSSVDGSRVWRGSADGRKWMHDSLLREHGHTTGREDIR
jgi:hypothetical protein